MNKEDILKNPRYAANPGYFLFDLFVADTILPLATDQAEWVAALIQAGADSWRSKTKTILTLSETIEVAILDLWYRNSEIAKAQSMEYSPFTFAQDFVDNYNAEGSLVDVWGPGALEAAQERIRIATGSSSVRQ